MPHRRRAVVLVTGASSGIGKACADHLVGAGYRVYGTSRQAAFPQEGQDHGTVMIPMDVTDENSVQRAVDWLLEQEGRLDVLVNNAGFGIAGAVEDTSMAEAQAQMDTNFMGAVRCCRAVLPAMREQGQGLIVNISSIAGCMGIPFQAFYSASKFALEGLTEALSLEVQPFGIDVCLIQPGDHRTGFTSNRRRTQAAEDGSVYGDLFETALDAMERSEMEGPTPEGIARVLQRIIESPSPRLRYVVGPTDQRLSVLIKRLLPGRLFERILGSYYDLG